MGHTVWVHRETFRLHVEGHGEKGILGIDEMSSSYSPDGALLVQRGFHAVASKSFQDGPGTSQKEGCHVQRLRPSETLRAHSQVPKLEILSAVRVQVTRIAPGIQRRDDQWHLQRILKCRGEGSSQLGKAKIMGFQVQAQVVGYPELPAWAWSPGCNDTSVLEVVSISSSRNNGGRSFDPFQLRPFGKSAFG